MPLLCPYFFNLIFSTYWEVLFLYTIQSAFNVLFQKHDTYPNKKVKHVKTSAWKGWSNTKSRGSHLNLIRSIACKLYHKVISYLVTYFLIQTFSFSHCRKWSCSGMNEIRSDKGYSLQFLCLSASEAGVWKVNKVGQTQNFCLQGNFSILFQMIQVIMKNENNHFLQDGNSDEVLFCKRKKSPGNFLQKHIQSLQAPGSLSSRKRVKYSPEAPCMSVLRKRLSTGGQTRRPSASTVPF